MERQIPVLILIGPPGGGKGTQGDIISKKLNISKISTGDLLRDELKSQSKRSEELRTVMSSGGLVDDKIVLSLLKEKISQKECEAGFILDGFPRNVLQAEELQELLSGFSAKLKLIAIDVAVSDQKIIDRIINRYYCKECKTNYNKLYKNPAKDNICDVCGSKGKFAVREDDSEEVVKSRLLEYHKKTAPVLAYYDDKGLLLKINGDQPIDKVTNDIDSKLKKILTY